MTAGNLGSLAAAVQIPLMIPAATARQHIRRLRGGSQAQLLAASDGRYYVTKFTNNPQARRVLANEMLASRLGLLLGLPMAKVAIIEVPADFIADTPTLHIEGGGYSDPFDSGLQLGVEYVGDPTTHVVADYLPDSMLANVANLHDLARCLVLDKWTSNADGRQVVFHKKQSARRYELTLIDQGYCFNAEEWDFPDAALRGTYAKSEVYAHVNGWDSFSPVLERAEKMSLDDIWSCAHDIPSDWFGGKYNELASLIAQLYQRRRLIRSLIDDFRNSTRNPFPNWRDQ